MDNELIDITEIIVPDETSYFTDEEAYEIYETCIHLMEEFVNDNPTVVTEEDFVNIFDDNIEELMHIHFKSDICYTDECEDEMDEIIQCAKDYFFKFHVPLRSHSDAIIINENLDLDIITKQIEILRNKPQPVQRTKEWYEFRHNLITASNAYKAFESQTVQNQLIYEKCQPLNPQLYIDKNDNETINDDNNDKIIKPIVSVNTNSTLHWGQKYEPLSVKLYEKIYNTTIEDFGCIKHDLYPFLGASPDGINVDKNSERYGRMLEIKNIVNREINGIPKKEYWIQMQLQMEVCNLDECDFLETKFTEYSDATEYANDVSDEKHVDEDGVEFQNICLSKDNKMKGLFIYFQTKEGKPYYVYKPLDLIHPNKIQEWHEHTVGYYQSNTDFNYTYIKTNYWKLEKISCVLVCRNKLWFKNNINALEQIWRTIEHERINGYEHRAPNRRQVKDKDTQIKTEKIQGCLLKFNKESGKITVNKVT